MTKGKYAAYPEATIRRGPVTSRQCVGTSSRSGQRCQASAMRGRDYCYKHGGTRLQGIANPSFKTGQFSKVMPARLVARYQEHLTNPDKLALDEQMAILAARLEDLVGRVDTGESGAIWVDLQAAWQQFAAARRSANTDEGRRAMAEALDAVGRLITRGYADHRAWADVRDTIQDYRKLTEAERRRQVEAQETLTLQQAMTLIGALQESVLRHVTDQATRAAIGNDIIRVTQFKVR